MVMEFTPVMEFYGAHAALLNQRVMQWSHTDTNGFKTDTLQLTVNIEGLDGLPDLGGKIGFRTGFQETGLVEKGQFLVTGLTPTLFPMQLVVTATAAPFSMLDESGYRQRRSASYGPTTLGALFRQLVTRHGFSPRVSLSLEDIPIPHIDQSNESDMAFITRLAAQHCAVGKPYNELYVLAEKGQVRSVSGVALPEVTLSVTQDNRPGNRAFISAKLDEKSKASFQGSRVKWWDAGAGKQRVVEVGVAPFNTLTQRYQTEAQARVVALAELRQGYREGVIVLIECPGNPLLTAEGVLRLDESWPVYMQGRWSINTVVHTHNVKTGYRSLITAGGLSV